MRPSLSTRESSDATDDVVVENLQSTEKRQNGDADFRMKKLGSRNERKGRTETLRYSS